MCACVHFPCPTFARTLSNYAITLKDVFFLCLWTKRRYSPVVLLFNLNPQWLRNWNPWRNQFDCVCPKFVQSHFVVV